MASNTNTSGVEGQLRSPSQKVVSILGATSLVSQGEVGAAARTCFVADRFITALGNAALSLGQSTLYGRGVKRPCQVWPVVLGGEGD